MYNVEKKSWNIYHHNFTWKALRKTEVKPNACSQVTLGMIWEWEDLEEIDKNTNEYNSRQSVVCAIISVEIKCDKSVRNLVGDRSVCWNLSSVQFSSVTQSCPILCDPMDCSSPGLPVHHQLPEFTQTHVY